MRHRGSRGGARSATFAWPFAGGIVRWPIEVYSGRFGPQPMYRASAQEVRLMRALLTIGLAAALAVGARAQSTELKVGDTAPDFSLQASDGKTYKLSDYKGKKAVVVAWFPKAFTQGCTIECKSLAENGDKIKMYDV